ncbi:MAG: AzlD domain-containing protein [Clostridia bacterium]|nr:AzlD domain-containing protein [Clostridia bacterium]
MNQQTAWLSVLIMALVTALLRILPFIVFGGKRKTPKLVEKLSRSLPYAIMGMLVVYCLKGVSFREAALFVPSLIASAVVIALHVWRRNTLLSIVSGTVCYMLLVQLVF